MAVLAVVQALAIAGCVSPDDGVVTSVPPVADGDAWTYELVTEGMVSRESRVVLGLAVGANAQPVVAIASAGPLGAAVDLLSGPATSLGRTHFPADEVQDPDEPIARTEEVWREPCPLLPAVLEPGSTTARCQQRVQILDPDGDTIALFLETLTLRFTVQPDEDVETPAGTFRAWPIDLEYTSQAGSALVARVPARLWYAPDACAVIREVSDGFVRQLTAFRCTATGRSAGSPAEVPGAASFAAQAAEAFGADPAIAHCFIPYSGAGLAAVEVDPLGLDCRLPDGLAGAGLQVADTLRIEASWDGRTAPTSVNLAAAGRTASGTAAPVVLEVPAPGLDPASFRASVHADGPAVFDEFTLAFRLLPEPADDGWPA